MAWMVNDYPEPKEPERICHCPICGDECIEIYIRRVDHEILGCNMCIYEEYPEDYE